MDTLEQRWRIACKLLAALALESPDCAACAALSDSKRTRARHAERAGGLRGTFRKAGMLTWCCSMLIAPFGDS